MHSSARPYQALPDRKELLLGNGELHFMSYFTPGHTVASTSILIDNQYLLSGDAIFVNGIGRPDLKGQAKVMANKMFETIQQLNKDISEKCLILPGHYASQEEINEQGFIGATYGDIQQCVHLLKVNDRQVFVTETLQNLGDTPPNFEKITKINQGKVVVDEQEQSLLEIGPNLCAVSNVG